MTMLPSSWRGFRTKRSGMTDKSLQDRVSALEAQLRGKPLDEHFREQAELIDRLFVYRLDEFRKQLHAEVDAKLETKLDAKLKPIKTDVAIIKHAVGVILTRLT